MNSMILAEAKEKGRLLSEALTIIEKLSKNDIADTDIAMDGYEDKSVDEVKTLIIKARSLTSDRWWEYLTKI
jgi:hypothetical protein